ncbi:hypothetical protein AB0J51_15985 [Micromonospora echinofusca]|uniref:hypothetical protein n=1 Tax=Micromonospora echinofusca TaxID=47858 RepID=UPI00341FA7B2
MSNRLWFRVEDVLPLAEHALACPTHRLTNAQVAAGEHNTPALTLRRAGSEGQLRSNGVPVWHTTHGAEQVAYGGSWRLVGARPEPDQHWYLPLRHADPDGRRLIDVLLAGRALDRNWLAIDTDTGPGCTLDARHVQLSDHRADIAPSHVRWRPVMVTSPKTGDRDYPALVADGYDAGENGYLICRFHPHTVRQMAADLAGAVARGHDAGGVPAAALRRHHRRAARRDRRRRRHPCRRRRPLLPRPGRLLQHWRLPVALAHLTH